MLLAASVSLASFGAAVYLLPDLSGDGSGAIVSLIGTPVLFAGAAGACVLAAAQARQPWPAQVGLLALPILEGAALILPAAPWATVPGAREVGLLYLLPVSSILAVSVGGHLWQTSIQHRYPQWDSTEVILLLSGTLLYGSLQWLLNWNAAAILIFLVGGAWLYARRARHGGLPLVGSILAIAGLCAAVPLGLSLVTPTCIAGIQGLLGFPAAMVGLAGAGLATWSRSREGMPSGGLLVAGSLLLVHLVLVFMFAGYATGYLPFESCV